MIYGRRCCCVLIRWMLRFNNIDVEQKQLRVIFGAVFCFSKKRGHNERCQGSNPYRRSSYRRRTV